MAYDTRIATRISAPVDRRLRMQALVKGQSLSEVLDSTLDKALPSAEELATRLGTEAGRAEEVAD